MKRIAAAIALGVAASAAGGDDAVRTALRVYVTAAQVPRVAADDDARDALKLKRDQARQARRVLENELKEVYRGGRKSWPAEKEAEVYRLEQVEALADADYEYRKADPRAALQAASDIVASFQERQGANGGQRMTLTSSAAEADLVLEVAACRTGKSFPTQSRPDRCYVLFTLGAGGKMDPKQFGKVPADYRIKRFGTRAWRIAGPTRDRPVFHFESYNGGGNEFGCQGAAASAASAAVAKLSCASNS